MEVGRDRTAPITDYIGITIGAICGFDFTLKFDILMVSANFYFLLPIGRSLEKIRHSGGVAKNATNK